MDVLGPVTRERRVVHEFPGDSEASRLKPGLIRDRQSARLELVPVPILPNSGTSVAKANSERELLTQR
jgi:hypothetical protein